MPRRSESALDAPGLAALLRQQAGVVSHDQLIGLSASRADVRRLLHRRALVQVHRAVYVDHTGPLSNRQREWAALLLHAPAALHRESALAAHGMTQDRSGTRERTIRLMVEHHRRIDPVPGVVVERVVDWHRWVLPGRRPPRARVEYAALKVAAGRNEEGAIALLSDVVHQGLTTPERLLEVVTALTRLPGRAGLREVLHDVASGSRSVLEARYLRDVERAHGLPGGRRQVRQDTASGLVVRDVLYDDHATCVELDGAFGHRDTLDRWADLQRDVDAAADGVLTLRVGWAQVIEPCRLAGAVAQLLRPRGWPGTLRGCGEACTAPVSEPFSVDVGVLGRA